MSGERGRLARLAGLVSSPTEPPSLDLVEPDVPARTIPCAAGARAPDGGAGGPTLPRASWRRRWLACRERRPSSTRSPSLSKGWPGSGNADEYGYALERFGLGGGAALVGEAEGKCSYGPALEPELAVSTTSGLAAAAVAAGVAARGRLCGFFHSESSVAAWPCQAPGGVACKSHCRGGCGVGASGPRWRVS